MSAQQQQPESLVSYDLFAAHCIASYRMHLEANTDACTRLLSDNLARATLALRGRIGARNKQSSHHTLCPIMVLSQRMLMPYCHRDSCYFVTETHALVS